MSGQGAEIRDHAKGTRPWLRRRYMGVAFLLVMLGALSYILTTLINKIFPEAKDNQTAPPQPSPEILLPLFLIFGLIVLLLVLMVVALITSFVVGRKGPNGPEALGMPEGSVSAVIALLLLLVFAVFSVFFFNQIRAGEGDGFVSHGVTSDVLKSLPQDRILEMTVENPQAAAADRTFSVKLAAIHRDSIGQAQNAATLIGTLLSAVAGLYLGGKATKMGATMLTGTVAPGQTVLPVTTTETDPTKQGGSKVAENEAKGSSGVQEQPK